MIVRSPAALACCTCTAWLLALCFFRSPAAAQEPREPSVPSAPSHSAGIAPPAADERHDTELEELARARTRERRALMDEGRPSYYTRRRSLGIAAIALGAATGLVTGFVALVAIAAPHSNDELSRRDRAVFAISGGLGAGILGVGIWAMVSARLGNPYRDRIEELAREEQALKRKLKRLRRARLRASLVLIAPVLERDLWGTALRWHM